MNQPAWRLSASSVGLGVIVCFAMSTQFLFQRSLYTDWAATEIAVAWLRGFGNLVVVAGAAFLTVGLAGRLPAESLPVRAALFAAALLAGALLGEWVALGIQWGAWPATGFDVLLPRAARWLPIGAVAFAVLALRRRASESATQLETTEIARLRLERQHLAVQLQILQGQIEPHFLFNTLATIRRLHQTDRVRGRETLAGFIHYLRSALPELRVRETTLGREVDLIGAYLEVLRVRMGSRLDFSIDVPPSLRDCSIPPLSLATLVENSVKHGLSSLPEGGHLAIAARRHSGRLLVSVADSGVGLTTPAGSGMGLANLRVRLRGLYGDAGTLTLAPNLPRGLVVTLTVPLADRVADDHSHA